MTAGHASVMSRCFPVLKIIASGEKHDNTGINRDTVGSNRGSPWTFSVFVFGLKLLTQFQNNPISIGGKIIGCFIEKKREETIPNFNNLLSFLIIKRVILMVQHHLAHLSIHSHKLSKLTKLLQNIKSKVYSKNMKAPEEHNTMKVTMKDRNTINKVSKVTLCTCTSGSTCMTRP